MKLSGLPLSWLVIIFYTRVKEPENNGLATGLARESWCCDSVPDCCPLQGWVYNWSLLPTEYILYKFFSSK